MLLGCNPTKASRWTKKYGLPSDIAGIGYAEGGWSVACNLALIAAGWVGWMVRSGFGGIPPLVAVMICTGTPYWDQYSDCHLVDGRIHAWNKAMWVPGERISAAGWPANQVPFGDINHGVFANGQKIPDGTLWTMLKCLTTDQVRTIALEILVITGDYPDWWQIYKRRKGISG
jgi:hypothetical protein